MLGFFVFFFNDTATTEIYTLSLHDALPISRYSLGVNFLGRERTELSYVLVQPRAGIDAKTLCARIERSEEHTSELQSLAYLVCRLLLEKKKIDGSNLLDGQSDAKYHKIAAH